MYRLLGCVALCLVACSTSSSTPDAGNAGDASDAATSTPMGSCTVTSPGPTGLLISGRLLLPSGPTDGELLVDGTGIIACASASCASFAGYASATHVACTNVVVSPGLINAHDHTNYATISPENHGMIRYDHRNDWRTGAEGATPLPAPPRTTDDPTIAAQELRMILGGTTSILGEGGVRGLVRNLAGVPTPAAVEGLTELPTYFDTFPLGDEDGELITSGCAYPSIQVTGGAFYGGQRYAPHIAEGVNLAAENELTCTNAAGLVTNLTSVIHGVGLNADDVAVVQKAGSLLIWSPRSNLSLYGDTASITEYRYAGIPIALGTDWLPSGSMNELRELACADAFNQTYLNGTFSDQDLWQMATANAAAAVGFAGEIGTLEAGKVADVALFDAAVNQDYRAVIGANVEDVHLVLRGGQPLYGDAALVSAIGSTLASPCAALSVCNLPRAVCFDAPGIALSDAQNAAASVYPLFFCRGSAPTGEPTCVPYRSTYPSGVAAGDKDGDGVLDTSDDCPSIFNPVRPMDGTSQADVDGDGVGDACDAKPLDPTMH
jgi:large repetitive protein